MLILLITTSIAAGAAPALAPRAQATKLVVVERIEVVRRGAGVEIEITGSGAMQIRTSRLSDPDRLVVDVPGSALAPELSTTHSIAVDSAEVKSVRISRLVQPSESTTRIVVDLVAGHDLQVIFAAKRTKVQLRTAGFQDAPVKAVKKDTKPSQRATPAVNRRTARKTPKSPPVQTAGYGKGAAPAVNRRTAKKTPKSPPVQTAEYGKGAAPAVNRRTAKKPPKSPPVQTAEYGKGAAPAVNRRTAKKPPKSPPVQTAEYGKPGPVPAPAPPPSSAPLGAGVTGKGKDPTLGTDRQEAVIRATLPVNRRFEPRNRELSVPFALRLSGTATAGYYQANTVNGHKFDENSPAGNLRLDASGFVHSPGFLSFTVTPQGSLGRQSSEGIFPDGEGLAATTTLFGTGVSPISVSYQRMDRKLVTFGPLDRLAGLEAKTFQKVFGANWKLRLRGLPELGVNFSKFSDSYEPSADLAPKTANSGRFFSANLTDKLFGWNLEARYKLDRSSQDLINIFDPLQAPYLYKRNNQEVRGAVDREFGTWLSTSVVGGKTKAENEVQGRPFDQSFRFLSGNTIVRPSKKLSFSFRAGITDNIVGATLEQATGGPSTTPPPLVLVPTSAKLQLVNYSGSVQYAFTNDLRAQVDVIRETTKVPLSSIIANTASTLTSLQASLAYVHRFRRWQFQSSYAANGGEFTYASSGSSRSTGHRANASATVGSLQTLELTAGVRGSLQNVRGNTYVHDHSAGANVALSRTLRDRWRLRATYDYARDQYKFLTTQYSSDANGITVAVVHPRAELSASHNVRDGLTFQADPRLQFVPGGVLLGAFPGTLVVPTGANWNSAALAIHPIPKLTGRVAWLNSRQKLQSLVNNRYSEWEASAGYQFRSITVDAGYLAHDQNFSVDLYRRNRFFFRVVRQFTIF